MAFLMFSTSIGFSMDMHYCGNNLESISFFGAAEKCEMAQPKLEIASEHACCSVSQKEVEGCNDSKIVNGNCCHDETMMVENNCELNSFDFSFEHVQQVIILGVLLFPNFNIFEISTEPVIYSYYIPPIISQDISILNQVFRI